MGKYRDELLKLLNIQIGCMLRLARLKKGLSQQELSLLLGSNSINIGRVERAENVSGWDKIFLMSLQLGVDYCDLFRLKDEKELLSIVEESLKLETKLNQEKRDYYSFLKKRITNTYKSLL